MYSNPRSLNCSTYSNCYTFRFIQLNAFSDYEWSQMFTTGDPSKVRGAKWHKVTYLIVVYTPGGKDPMLYNYRNEGAGGRHAEVIFIDDVKREVFPGNGTFELYMNYTPCTLCCDLLFKLMETEKKKKSDDLCLKHL